jgi:putative ABC transport system permease protein
MKAVGAADSHILTVFLLEAGMVGLAGGAGGVAVALLLQQAINQAVAGAPAQPGGMMFLPIDPNMLQGELVIIPPELVLFALGLALLVGMGAGFYPALRAARLQPVIALKTD